MNRRLFITDYMFYNFNKMIMIFANSAKHEINN